LDASVIASLVEQVAQAKKEGQEVILVSSGAVGAGRALLSLPDKLNQITKRQVFAAVGQVELMKIYTGEFGRYGLHCAQVLATKEDFRDREHFVNMKRCLLALLRDNIVPVINENDVISISELMFTDNDELAGLTASLVSADALVILSNVDGVLDEHGAVIPIIDALDEAVHAKVTTKRSSFGRGGMLTKLRFCQQAARLGIHTFIANGKKRRFQGVLRQTEPSSYFPAGRKRSNLKHWMAYSDGSVQAKVFVNEGAARILKDAASVASLLPVGVTGFDKKFKKGEVIGIEDESGKLLGIGIAAYGSKELKQYQGKQGGKELVHYDYLLIY
jgi:glutamate 5-kinase